MKSSVICLSLPNEVMEYVKKKAQEEDFSFSMWVRRLIIKEKQKEENNNNETTNVPNSSADVFR